tara:strand:+ start:1280 stop:2206 length:927 start_codon:yes stop_codon:yes gene_type:complete
MKIKKPKFWDYNRLSFYSLILFPFSLVYSIAHFVNSFFKKSKKFKIPVVCVGNIYLGGTGKTPLAIKIFNITKSLGKNPAFVKKHYSYVADEIKMLEKTGKTFSTNKRETGILLSIENQNDLAILDDGFQDFSIKPNFSILCFNSKQLIGNGFLIPSGPLRERLKAVLRADCIVINGNENTDFENKLKKITGNKDLPIFYSEYKIKNLEKFINKEIIAFAGIGNPSNFFDLLKEKNIKLKQTFSFPDHHNYTTEDFDKIIGDRSTKIVTTEKDYYRMTDQQKKSCEYIEVELIIREENKFKNLLKQNI